MPKFVALPSTSGNFVLDAERVVHARSKGAGTVLGLTNQVSITVTAPLDKVLATLGTLHLQALAPSDDGGHQTAWFNHRHLDFASINDAGKATFVFGSAGVQVASDDVETVLVLLNRLEEEARQR